MGVHKTTGTAKRTDTLWYADLRRITDNPSNEPSIEPTTEATELTIEPTIKPTTEPTPEPTTQAYEPLVLIITAVILILSATIIYCKRLQNNKIKAQKDEDDNMVDNEEDNKENEMIEPGMDAAETKHDEQRTQDRIISHTQTNDHEMTLDKKRKSDISLLVTSEGCEEKESDSFNDMFVEVHGELSISKSDHNKTLCYGQGTTEGVKDQKESFHGTKGDYYD
eukprot:260599_1